MPQKTQNVVTFIHPSGFIEQHYLGTQTGETVADGVHQVSKLVSQFHSEGKKALVLVSLDDVTDTNLDSHAEAVKGMKEVPCDRLSIYGSLRMQVLLNTLILVADKTDIARAFGDRIDALRWLREGKE